MECTSVNEYYNRDTSKCVEDTTAPNCANKVLAIDPTCGAYKCEEKKAPQCPVKLKYPSWTKEE